MFDTSEEIKGPLLNYFRFKMDLYSQRAVHFTENVVVDGHRCHTALLFGVKAKENQDKFPTLYWLPKLYRNPIKQDLLLILVL